MTAGLTSKSIREHLDMLLTEGRLRKLIPSLPGMRQERIIYVTEDLYGQISDTDDWPLAYPMVVLRADLDQFMSGGKLTFSVGRDRNCQIKILDPWCDEVWEIRSRGRKPGARVLGRFIGPDEFIALCWADRDQMDFAIEIRRCKAEWRKLFGTYLPMTGTDPSDYITSNIVDFRLGR